MSYLIDLAARLAAGTAHWPDEFRWRHAEYLRAAQQPDGGFAGRRGASDPYYTSFGLQGLALLGALDEATAARAAEFLLSRDIGTLSSVDGFSLIFGSTLLKMLLGRDMLGGEKARALVAAIDGRRRADGGFAKSARGGASSTYHTFLAVLCRQLLGVEPGPAGPMVELVLSRRRNDGGFVEIPQMRAGGTNPTAAAVVLLAELDRLDDATADGAARFLVGLQNNEGGFRANGEIPMADLLSTFTALTALARINRLAAIDPPAAARFARSLERPEGGFHGFVGDDAADVEYTFYGLGTLALTGG